MYANPGHGLLTFACHPRPYTPAKLPELIQSLSVDLHSAGGIIHVVKCMTNPCHFILATPVCHLRFTEVVRSLNLAVRGQLGTMTGYQTNKVAVVVL